jgi:hypothetical protein
MVYANKEATQASEKPINLPEAFDRHWGLSQANKIYSMLGVIVRLSLYLAI